MHAGGRRCPLGARRRRGDAVVAGLAHDHGAREVIKVKSIATDEIGLNEALAGPLGFVDVLSSFGIE